MTIAILIDAGYLRKEFQNNQVHYNEKSVREMIRHIRESVRIHQMRSDGKTSSLIGFRTFFYDAPSYRGKIQSKSGKSFEFYGKEKKDRLLTELKKNPNIIVREGHLSFSKWKLNEKLISPLINDISALIGQDDMKERVHRLFETVADKVLLAIQGNKFPDIFYEPEISQKEVDTLLTRDLLQLSKDESITKIVLVTNDTDFVPAIADVNETGKETLVVAIAGKEVTHRLRDVVNENVLNIDFPETLDRISNPAQEEKPKLVCRSLYAANPARRSVVQDKQHT